MSNTSTTSATLYREDPQYIDDYGAPGTQLKSTDAYVEIEEIDFDKVTEKTQFSVQCTERKKNGTSILPIQESIGLEFKFMQAYGFLYPVFCVEVIDLEQRIFQITLEFDPDLIGSRIIHFLPLTARYIGNHIIELERLYEHEMKNPYCMRGKFTTGERLLKLTRDSYNSQKFKLSDGKELEEGERVQVLSNWNPSSVRFRKDK